MGKELEKGNPTEPKAPLELTERQHYLISVLLFQITESIIENELPWQKVKEVIKEFEEKYQCTFEGF